MIEPFRVACSIILIGACCPRAALHAGDPFAQSFSSDEAFSKDVSLSDSILTGKYVNLAGAGIQNARASVRQAGHEVATAITDAQGNFTVPGLKTGVYEVVLGNRSEFFRLWEADVAPPAAFPEIHFMRDGKLHGNGGTVSAMKLIGSGGNPSNLLEGLFGNDPGLKEIPLVFPIVP